MNPNTIECLTLSNTLAVRDCACVRSCHCLVSSGIFQLLSFEVGQNNAAFLANLFISPHSVTSPTQQEGPMNRLRANLRASAHLGKRGRSFTPNH